MRGSFYDTKGKLYIDCAECCRGGNGEDKDSCSCGFKIKKINKGGCFIGDLLPAINKDNLKRLRGGSK